MTGVAAVGRGALLVEGHHAAKGGFSGSALGPGPRAGNQRPMRQVQLTAAMHARSCMPLTAARMPAHA